jgi:hypothetical protein
MPVHFDFSRVHNHEAVTTNPTDPTRWHPVADALVWLSMICGYNEITEKNVEKVIERIMQFQSVKGAFLRGGRDENNSPKPIYIMPTDVKRFIGMHTNASPFTDAQWRRKVADLVYEDAARLAAERRPSALDTVAMLANAQPA